MRNKSLVIIMPISGENINVDFCFENTINKSVFFRYLSTPAAFWFAFQWFWMSQTCLRMFIKFSNKLYRLLIGFRFVTKQFFQVLLSLFFNDNTVVAHKLRMYLSSSSTLSNLLPGCFSARSIFARNSSLVINVESFFSFTNFLAYRVRRFINDSLSAMAPMLCQSSVFIEFKCTAFLYTHFSKLGLRYKELTK